MRLNMNENANSTSGMLEDLIRAMVQFSAIEVHAKTALEKAKHELAVCDDDLLEEAILDEQNAEKHLLDATTLRRNSMTIIADYAHNLNPEKWCEVKHASMGMYTAFEAYQANSSDLNLYDLYIAANNIFIEIVSDWLGLDIPPCAACFSDALKGGI